MATIVVGRQLPDGITAGMFLVDMACYGLKDAFGLAGLLPSEFGGILDEWGQPSGGFQPCGLDLARELVWGGIAWARKWSFSLPKNYSRWVRLLGPTDGDEETDLTRFGRDGEPDFMLDLGDLLENLPPIESLDEVLKLVDRNYGDGSDPVWQSFVGKDRIVGCIQHADREGVPPPELEALLADITMLADYPGRADYNDLSELPFWQYSVCLEWMAATFTQETRYELTYDNALRFLSNLLRFYSFLIDEHEIVSCAELQRACDIICGSGTLKPVEHIPYTGREMWDMAKDRRDGTMVLFRVHDFWIFLLCERSGTCWEKLIEEAQGVPSAEAKLRLIQSAGDKVDHLTETARERLLRRAALRNASLEDARDWFYKREVEYDIREV